MTDLIEREKVSEYPKNLFKGYISDGYNQVDTVDCSALVQAVVKDTPITDTTPSAYAHWFYDSDNELICSRCGQIHGGGFSYCSYCGAKMGEEEHK